MGELLVAIGANIEVIHIILFVLGMAALTVEMLEPGFGIFGISGIALLVLDIIILADDPTQAAVLFLILAFIVLFLLILFFTLASFGVIPKKLKLEETVGNGEALCGVSGIKSGDVGTALTALRPSGKAMFGNISVDVVSNGEFIPKDAAVVVTEINGNRISVRLSNRDETLEKA